MNQGHIVLQSTVLVWDSVNYFATRLVVTTGTWRTECNSQQDGCIFPSHHGLNGCYVIFICSYDKADLLSRFRMAILQLHARYQGTRKSFYCFCNHGVLKKKKSNFIRTKPLFRAHSKLIKGPISTWPVYHLSVSVTTVIVGFIAILSRYQIVPDSFSSTP